MHNQDNEWWYNNVFELKRRCPDLHIDYCDYDEPNIEISMDCDEDRIWTMFIDGTNGNKKMGDG